MEKKRKKRIVTVVCILMLVVIAGLGYWKRIGIRNTLMRMAGMDPTKTYGYYGREVEVDLDVTENLNILESDQAGEKIIADIPREESPIVQTKEIDEAIEAELDSGVYTWREPLILNNPYKISPLTGLILFETKEPCRVRITVKGKDRANDLTGELEPATRHRIPVIGLYPSFDNQILLEIVDDNGNTLRKKELTITTSGLPESLQDVVKVEKSEGTSAYGLTLVCGQKTRYPFAFDSAGDVRWYLEEETADTGLFALSNQRLIMQVKGSYTPSIYKPQTTNLSEVDYLGRFYSEYYVANGTHHEVIEKEPGGNLLVLSNSLEDHVEDLILELDRKSGKVVNSLNLSDIFGETYVNKVDWAHINTVSYQKEDDTIVISPRNLHSAMKINWTTHELVWILSDPAFWEDTGFEEYVLKPESEFFWHYQQHTAYQIEKDLDGDPDTIHLSLFDNHTQHSRKVKSFDGRKDSYLKVYKINEKEMTVDEEKEFSVQWSRIASNAVYDTDSDHVFGMCGWLMEDPQERYGKIYEFDYASGNTVRQYSLKYRFYRAIEMKISYEELAAPFETDEEYIKGELRPAVKTEKNIKEPKKMLEQGVDFYLHGSVLFMTASDHNVSQVIFAGEEASYVYDITDIKLKKDDFLDLSINMPIPVGNFDSGDYKIYCVYRDIYYDTGVSFSKK